MKVYPENKKHDLLVISIENQFLVSFSLDPALYYATPRHNPRFDFFKNGFKLSARLKEKKRHEVSARKNSNRLRYNKKCRGGWIPPPSSFRVKIVLVVKKELSLNSYLHITTKFSMLNIKTFLMNAVNNLLHRYFNTVGNCAAVDHPEVGRWQIDRCTDQKRFFCERVEGMCTTVAVMSVEFFHKWSKDNFAKRGGVALQTRVEEKLMVCALWSVQSIDGIISQEGIVHYKPPAFIY